MTVEQARAVIERLQAGLSVTDDEVQAAADALVNAGLIPYPGRATSSQLRQILASEQIGGPPNLPEELPQRPDSDEEDEADKDRLKEAVTKRQYGMASDEDMELIESASWEELKAVLDSLNEPGHDYSWVYNEGMILPGALDDQSMLLRLYEFFADPDIGLIEPDRQTVPRRRPEDRDRQAERGTVAYKIERVQRLLSEAGGNPLVQAALQAFAEQEGIYKPENDVLNIMTEFGLDRTKAKAIVELSRTTEVDPERVAEVYKNQAGLDPNRGGWAAEMGYNRMSFVTIAQRYKQGLDLYGTHLMAAVHANDAKLAARLVADPWALDSAEIDRILGMIDADGERNANDPQVQWLKQRRAGAYSQADTAAVDKDAVREAVTTLAQSWNLTSNMDPIAESVIREVVSSAIAEARALIGNPFSRFTPEINVLDTIQNVTANVAARLRALPEYQQLFAHKSAAESEEEYVHRFESRTQQLFGENLADPTRIGMMSGSTNAVWQTGITTDIGQDNTRWQEIMARNAETFRRLL